MAHEHECREPQADGKWMGSALHASEDTPSAPRRRCLVLAGVFPPAGGAGSLRLVKLLKYLPACGVDVHVLAPLARRGWFFDEALNEEIAGLSVTRTGLPFSVEGLLAPLRRYKSVLGAGSPHAATTQTGTPASLATLLPLATLRSLIDGGFRRGLRLGRDLRNALATPDEYLGWAVSAWHVGDRVLRASRDARAGTGEAYDVIVSASFPYSAHLAGLALRQRFAIPWIADFADPWAGHRFRGQESGSGLTARLHTYGERLVGEHADLITVASPGMVEQLRERYAKPVHLITNTFDPADFAGPPSDAGGPLLALDSARDRARLTVLFVGTFDARLTPPDPFLAALTELGRRDPTLAARLRFRVLGGADLESRARINRFLATQANAGEGTGALWQFVGHVSHREAIAEMRAADALALSVAPGATWHLTAKVIEYLAAARPILAVVPPGDCRDLLQRAGGALIVDPDNGAALARHFETALAMGRFAVDRKPDPAAISDYSAPAVAARFATLVRTLAAQRTAARGQGEGQGRGREHGVTP